MARGITSFADYGERRAPGFMFYTCLLCSFQVQRQRGNALATSAKAKAAVRRHLLEKHRPPEGASIGLALDPKTCAWCGRPVERHAPEEFNLCAARLG